MSELAFPCEIEKVTDLNDIMEYGIMMTPGFAVDKQVKSAGKVLSPRQIRDLILKEKTNG